MEPEQTLTDEDIRTIDLEAGEVPKALEETEGETERGDEDTGDEVDDADQADETDAAEADDDTTDEEAGEKGE